MSILHIGDVHSDASGTYTLMATNAVNADSWDFDVSVGDDDDHDGDDDDEVSVHHRIYNFIQEGKDNTLNKILVKSK